jgi:hypothetical protein
MLTYRVAQLLINILCKICMYVSMACRNQLLQCMYLIYVCIVPTIIYVQYVLYACMHGCIHVCMCACMYIYMYAFMHEIHV